MSQASQPVDQGLEIQVFGRQPLAEDWLKDIRIRSSLIFMPLTHKDVTRLFTSRLTVRAGWAIPHAERIVKGLESRPNAFLIEAKRLREAVEGSIRADAGGTTLADAYLDDVETEVDEMLAERQRIQEEWLALKGPIDPRMVDRIGNVQRLIEAAVLERGSERGMLLRDARNILSELSLSQAVVHPVIWLYLGWTTWQLTENWIEVVPILQKATQHPMPTAAGFMALRLLSYFALLDDMPVKASEWSRKALEVHQTADAYVEAALCAATLHDPSTAKSYFESALVHRAGSLIGALADERVFSCGPELVEVAVRVQMRLRRDGRQSAAAWASSSREVAEAQRISGGGVHIPHELMEAHKSVLERLENADLIMGGYLNRMCRENALEVVDHARKSLQAEYVKRCDAVSLARRSIENAGATREQRIQAALHTQEEVSRHAKAALAAADLESEKAEKNSVFGFGSGCAMFALYMISYVILAGRGTVIGITTPVGMAATVVSAIPILSAVFMQATYAMKRMSVEAKVRELVKRAGYTYDEASKDADDHYREQLKHCRKSLSQAEAELRKVESAMRTLGVRSQTDTDGSEPAPQTGEGFPVDGELEDVAEEGDALSESDSEEAEDGSFDDLIEPAA